MPSMVEIMRRVADEYEQAEKAEQEQALREKVETLEQRDPADFVAAFKQLSPEQRREIADALGTTPAEVVKEKPKPVKAADEPKPDEPPSEPKTAERRTRPGRRKGRLYEYRVDEQGRVVETAVPTIYTGDDEADEVELPAAEEEETAAA